MAAIDGTYRQALTAGGFLADAGPHDLTLWRERGLRCADLLVAAYLRAVAPVCTPEVVEHPFLQPSARYDEVFGSYENVYRTELAGAPMVLRADNMHTNVDHLRASGQDAVLARGGVIRRMSGRAVPLFRERHIWPAVQLTHLVPRSRAADVLLEHQHALSRFFAEVGLPVVGVRTDMLSSYGSTCYLSVTCMPDGRPTVLSTAYVMADDYRQALGVEQAVLDIGWTGKVLALAAAHHHDHRGLNLAAAIAPTQVGIVPTAQGARRAGAVAATLRDAGLRVDVWDGPSSPSGRWRAERAFHRRGVPVVLEGDGGGTRVRRLPLQRTAAAVTADDVREELRSHDDRLRRRVEERLARHVLESDVVLAMCTECQVAGARPVFGTLLGLDPQPCQTCGRPSPMVLLSERGRFY